MSVTEYPIFKLFSAPQVENFVAACDKSTIPAGERFIEEATSGDRMYFLTEGTVRVTMDSSGTDEELATLAAPAVIGEMEYLTGEPRTASVTAVESTEVLHMSFEDIDARIADNDPATLKLFYSLGRILANRVSAMNQKFAEIQKRPETTKHLQEFQKKLLSDWNF